MIENQMYVFVMTVAIGSIMGLIFDLFRVIRRKGNTKDIVVYLQDILFWLLVTIIIIVSTFLINNGELRGYMIFGYVLGGIFYILLFSQFVRKTLSFIFDTIERIIKKIWDGIKYFFKRIRFFEKNKGKIEK